MGLTLSLSTPGKIRLGGITWSTLTRQHGPTSSVFGAFNGRTEDQRRKPLLPHEIPHVHAFRPIVIMFIGRRGKGKSLAMSALAHIQHRRYEQYSQRYPHRRPFGVAANYWVDFADVVSPYLVDDLMQFPEWGYNKYILIDEAAANFPSRRSMAGSNVTFSNFLTQIRKRNCEVAFTTQFPQVMDSQVLMQVDLFVRCNTFNGNRSVNLEVFDWWGQWTGRDYRKPWPPQSGYEDWTLRLHHLDRIWPLFNTNEIQAPIWSPKRDEIIRRQGWQFDDPAAELGDDWAPPVAPTSLAELIARVEGPLNVLSLMAPARVFQNDVTRGELAKMLEDVGFTILKKGGQLYAEKLPSGGQE